MQLAIAQLVVEIQSVRAHPIPGVALSSYAPGLAQAPAQGLVAQEANQGSGLCPVALRRHQESLFSMAQDFAIAGDVRGNDRAAAGHSLQQHNAKTLTAG